MKSRSCKAAFLCLLPGFVAWVYSLDIGLPA